MSFLFDTASSKSDLAPGSHWTQQMYARCCHPCTILQGLPLQALAVALQHPAVAADQCIMCTLLQVCKAWRAAVQQSAASVTNVVVRLGRDYIKVSSFAGWLAKHAGLIHTLKISALLDRCRRGGYSAHVQVAMQLLELGMQAAGSSGACAFRRLYSYKSSLPASSGLLAALPAATLTHLEVTLDSSNCFSPLSGLTSLRQVCLHMTDVKAEPVNRCLLEIGKLQHLTQLDLSFVAVEADMQLLPTQLQQLTLMYQQCYPGAGASTGACPQLQHLTALQELNLTARQLAVGSSVPPNLQSLALAADWPADGLVGLTSLQQLTSLMLYDFKVESEHIRVLDQLPQLTDLYLALNYSDTALEVAAAWQSAPLCTLEVNNITVSPLELQQLMQHVCAATKLTQLSLKLDILGHPEGQHDLAVCEHLRTLKKLGNLCLSIGSPGQFAVQDAQHLSALSTLTSLDLCNMASRPYLDATTLSLLVLKLTGLKELAVNVDSNPDEHRIGICALPAIGQLSNLESLSLESFGEEDAGRGLQLLTGLSRLQSLDGFQQAGSEALEAFWDTIQTQRRRGLVE